MVGGEENTAILESLKNSLRKRSRFSSGNGIYSRKKGHFLSNANQGRDCATVGPPAPAALYCIFLLLCIDVVNRNFMSLCFDRSLPVL